MFLSSCISCRRLSMCSPEASQYLPSSLKLPRSFPITPGPPRGLLSPSHRSVSGASHVQTSQQQASLWRSSWVLQSHRNTYGWGGIRDEITLSFKRYRHKCANQHAAFQDFSVRPPSFFVSVFSLLLPSLFCCSLHSFLRALFPFANLFPFPVFQSVVLSFCAAKKLYALISLSV